MIGELLLCACLATIVLVPRCGATIQPLARAGGHALNNRAKPIHIGLRVLLVAVAVEMIMLAFMYFGGPLGHH